MSEKDQTISVMPVRVNKKPIVLKMMTLSELYTVIIFGCVVGLTVGILMFLLFQFSFVLILLFMLAGAVIFLLSGGSLISRLKRNKPDTWLERYIDFKINPGKFITRDQVWSIKRSARSLK